MNVSDGLNFFQAVGRATAQSVNLQPSSTTTINALSQLRHFRSRDPHRPVCCYIIRRDVTLTVRETCQGWL